VHSRLIVRTAVALAVALFAFSVGGAPARAGKVVSPFLGQYHDFPAFAWSPSNGEIKVSSVGKISGSVSFSYYADYFTSTTTHSYRGRVSDAGALTVDVVESHNQPNGTVVSTSYTDVGTAALDAYGIVFTGVRLSNGGASQTPVTWHWYRH
jgi:hypothetical protein